jgi:AzlC protein
VAPALAMSCFVYAGSAQLAALPLMVSGAPMWLVLLTATIVNLRFVIFSAGLQPYFRHLSVGRRLVLGYDFGLRLPAGQPPLGRPRNRRGGTHRADLVLSRAVLCQLDDLAIDVRARHPAGGPHPAVLGAWSSSACWR